MWDIALNIFSEVILILAVSGYVLFTNRAELLNRLGYKKIHMDIPYDPENKLVLLVKARIWNYKAGAYVLPQTSKTAVNWEDGSIINSEELGLSRNLYNPKVYLKLIGKSNDLKKSYQICYVKISKTELMKAAKTGRIPWVYNEKTKVFEVNSVEYQDAILLPPDQALEILIKHTRIGTRPNPERSEIYVKAFKKLRTIFPQ